jgi:tripartite-type tricarboxylate transporter receptor subunit TctC
MAQQSFDPLRRPIQIIVPYPPGGATDKLARSVSQMFADIGWKSQVINRPGADTVIGANFAAKSPNDGHTLYMGGNGFLDANLVFGAPGIQYTSQSFAPIVPLGVTSLVLLVPESSPIRTYHEFKQHVVANPASFNLGFWNLYTANIFFHWAKLENLPRPNIINYKGSAPLIVDISGNHLAFAFDTITAAKEYIISGKIRAIAVLDNEGKNIMTSIHHDPTLVAIEQHQPSVALNIFYGLYAPANTDKQVIEQINRVINAALADPRYRSIWRALDTVAPGGTPTDLANRQQKFYNMFRQSQP